MSLETKNMLSSREKSFIMSMPPVTHLDKHLSTPTLNNAVTTPNNPSMVHQSSVSTTANGGVAFDEDVALGSNILSYGNLENGNSLEMVTLSNTMHNKSRVSSVNSPSAGSHQHNHDSLMFNEQQECQELETSSQLQFDAFMFRDFPAMTGTDVDSRTTATDVDSNNYVDDFSEIAPQSLKKVKIYNFILGYKFIIIVYAICFFLHICLWLILSGIDMAVYNNSGQRIMTIDVAMFDFTTGCLISVNTTYVLTVLTIIYLVAELVVIVMIFFADKDTWMMKRETILLFLLQIFLGICYLIASNIPAVKFMTDFFFPYAETVVIYSMIEVFIAVTLPCIYAIREDYEKEKMRETEMGLENSIVELFIKNKKTYQLILDFARRSYCAESLLCYRDIQRFRKSNRKSRYRIGKYILDTYLNPDSTVQLNLPSELTERITEWKTHIEANANQPNATTTTTGSATGSVLPGGGSMSPAIPEQLGAKQNYIDRKLFDALQVHCITDITDVFERLKASSKQVRDILDSWKKEAKEELQ